MTLLEVKALKKTYTTRLGGHLVPALTNVTFSVEKGEYLAIMGESGSGKTTSMRNLDPKTTYYIDADGKGLSWKGWRKQYSQENKNYFACESASTSSVLQKLARV